MLGFTSQPSTGIRQPTTRGGLSRSSFRAPVGGLLLDHDGEMHDPSYANSLRSLRSQLEQEAALRTSPSLNGASWRPSAFGRSGALDSDDSDSEEDVSHRVRDSMQRRRNHTIAHAASGSTLHATYRSTLHQRRPGSAGAAEPAPSASIHRNHHQQHRVDHDDEADATMEMLIESIGPSPSRQTLPTTNGGSGGGVNSSRKGSSGANSIRRLRTSSSRSRAGSHAASVSSLDDWQGSFTGIVDLQRGEWSRRNSQEAAALSCSSAVSLVSGSSTRPASPAGAGNGNGNGNSAAASRSRRGSTVASDVDEGRSGSIGLLSTGKRGASLSKRKVTDAFSRNRSASSASSNPDCGLGEFGGGGECGANDDDSYDAGVTITQYRPGASTAARGHSHRSPTLKPPTLATKDIQQASKRPSPGSVSSDLPLLTPLDENGGYRDYYQPLAAGDATATMEMLNSQPMQRGHSQRSSATSASSTSFENANDVLNAMKRKMQAVSLGVKFKAFKAERKFKKKFSGNAEASGGDAASTIGGIPVV